VCTIGLTPATMRAVQWAPEEPGNSSTSPTHRKDECNARPDRPYLACWNETDSTTRRELIAKTWADDASYIDPVVDAHGHDAIDAAIAATQGQFPGHVFTLAGPVDTHHDVARFSWGLGRDGDDPLVIGSDVASVDADGRLARVVGFLDKVPT
jgi:hypothetical protein